MEGSQRKPPRSDFNPVTSATLLQRSYLTAMPTLFLLNELLEYHARTVPLIKENCAL